MSDSTYVANVRLSGEIVAECGTYRKRKLCLCKVHDDEGFICYTLLGFCKTKPAEVYAVWFNEKQKEPSWVSRAVKRSKSLYRKIVDEIGPLLIGSSDKK